METTQNSATNFLTAARSSEIDHQKNELLTVLKLLCGNEHNWPSMKEVIECVFARLKNTRVTMNDIRNARRMVLDSFGGVYKDSPKWGELKSRIFFAFGRDGLERVTLD